jgi:hypothetical protein
MSEKNYETIKVWKATLKNLRLLHALSGESMVAIVHRLVLAEFARVQTNDHSQGVQVQNLPNPDASR